MRAVRYRRLLGDPPRRWKTR